MNMPHRLFITLCCLGALLPLAMPAVAETAKRAAPRPIFSVADGPAATRAACPPHRRLPARIQQPDAARAARAAAPCRYAAQNYRFRLYEKPGCALKNTRSASLVAPHNHRE